MTLTEIMFLIIILLSFIVYFMYQYIQRLRLDRSSLQSAKVSQSVRYGQISQQFLPLTSTYPYDHKNFRFLGTPIDGIQFNDDSVVFVEFKAASSKITPREAKIARLVASNKVYFETIRVSDDYLNKEPKTLPYGSVHAKENLK